MLLRIRSVPTWATKVVVVTDPERLVTIPTDTAGSVSVEYVVVLSLVSVGAVAALAALGVPLLNLYLYQQAVLLLPFP